jgi:hypothetical protein
MSLFQCRSCYDIVINEVPTICMKCAACSWVFVHRSMDAKQAKRLVLRYPDDFKLAIVKILKERSR